MKKANALKHIRSACGWGAFIVFLVLVFITKAPSTELRVPAQGYESVKEEYIAATEHFLATNQVVCPENAEFSYDGEVIKIKDKDADVYLECYLVLDNSVPVYDWHYTKHDVGFWIGLILFELIAVLIVKDLIAEFICSTYKRHYKKLVKNMEKAKCNAVYGDNRGQKRGIARNCQTCDYSDTCKCISCSYLGECGNCPATDCIDAFEEMVYETKLNHKNDDADEITDTDDDALPYDCFEAVEYVDESEIEMTEAPARQHKGLLRNLFRRKNSNEKNNDYCEELQDLDESENLVEDELSKDSEELVTSEDTDVPEDIIEPEETKVPEVIMEPENTDDSEEPTITAE